MFIFGLESQSALAPKHLGMEPDEGRRQEHDPGHPHGWQGPSGLTVH